VAVSLVRLRTADGVFLDGVTVDPKRRTETALVWVHGLGGVFSSGQPLIRELSACLGREGIGYFKFNTRGHDMVARGGRRLAGAAFERFADSIEDIRTVIAFARTSGYRKIVLAGHSTGANKVLHYLARTSDRRVSGLILLGPVSDIAGEHKQIGRPALERRVAVAERLAKRDPEALVPRAWGVWSARRYLSLYRPGEAEDVFPYYRPGARWAALRRVRTPIAAIVGSDDEFLERPAQELIDAFRRNALRSRSFAGMAVPGAMHGFQEHERELARIVTGWIRERVLS
jgi:pimeloyl-ACP methyl ester carboxylesterase